MIFRRTPKDVAHSSGKNETHQILSSSIDKSSPLLYSWIMTGKLAIGPIPRTTAQWVQLEGDGFRNRFSCCYPQEHMFAPIPKGWQSKQVALPDHRSQEPLTSDNMILALDEAIMMLNQNNEAMYLHCFAGQERSALMAVGIVCMIKGKDVFESLDFVRRCHKRAKPLYAHLDILDKAIRQLR